MGRGKGLPPPGQRRIRRNCMSTAALILAASFLLFTGTLTAQASNDGASVTEITATAEKSTASGNTPTTDHKAPGDGYAYVEITATLEKGTDPGDQPTPTPKPTGGGGGGDNDHHHHDDDTPPKKPDPKPETSAQPVVPVVYLPGPGITKVKAVPVPGEPEIRYVTRTVTGNEAILPEPGKPAEISVSGNGSVKWHRMVISAVPGMGGTQEDGKTGQWILIWILILFFFLVLAEWFFIVRKTGKSKADKSHDSSKDHELRDP